MADDADALRAELWNQWRYNHAEHCRREWPHHGDCRWPVPLVLQQDQKGAIEMFLKQFDAYYEVDR